MNVHNVCTDDYIMIWADGTWCSGIDLYTMTFMSDDYEVVHIESIPEDIEIEDFVENRVKSMFTLTEGSEVK